MAQRVVDASRRLAPPCDRRSARRQPADGDRAVLRIARAAAVLVALRADGHWLRRVGLSRCHRSPRTTSSKPCARSPTTCKQQDAALHLVRLPPNSSLSQTGGTAGRKRMVGARRRPTASARSSGLQGTRGIRFSRRLVLRIARRLAAGCARSSGTSPCGSSRSRTTRCGSTRSQSSSISIARASAAAERHFTRRRCATSISTSTDRLQRAGMLRLFMLHLNDEPCRRDVRDLVQRPLLLLSARLRFAVPVPRCRTRRARHEHSRGD